MNNQSIKKSVAFVLAATLVLILAFALAFAVAPQRTAQAAWDGEGNGTAESPYQIGTAAQLKKFRDIVNGTNGEKKNVRACAELTADINLAGSEEDQWVPIGALDDADVYLDYNTNELGYLGVFDGKGHTISGLYYNDTDSMWEYAVNDYIGLFGVVGSTGDDSGIVRNLTVAGSLAADDYVGGIAGVLYGTVENCVNNVTVTGNQKVGGIVGNAMPGSVIRRSTNNGALTGYGSLGGIAGYSLGYYDRETTLSIPSLVVNCANYGTVNGTSHNCIGGIVGYLHSYVSIVYCHNAGAITVSSTHDPYHDSSVGGIVGRCEGVDENGSYEDAQALVENCYNTGDITATSYNRSISGIVGMAGYSAMIRCCLNYGTLKINANTSGTKQTYGGVASRNFYSGESATVKNVYYKEGTAQNDGNATKKNDTELKDKETFKETSWGSTYYLDFDFCWMIGDVGPVFKSADSLDVAYVLTRIEKFLYYEDYNFYDDGPKIYTAKKAYDLLSAEQKEHIQTLREEYVEKLAEAVTVYAVLEKIHSVGKIYYSTDVKERLDTAQNAYDALSVEWERRLPEYEVSNLEFYQKQYANAVVLYDYLGGQGIGSDEDPFLISTKEQLFRINDVISASYKLVCDIDAGCDADHQWLPIGTYQGIENDEIENDEIENDKYRWSPYYEKTECRTFTGVLDGDGHTISNLYIDVSDKLGDNDYTYDHYAALIYSVGTEGKVKNLTVEGTIIGKGQIGGITAFNNGIIDGCVNKVNVVGLSYMGGIAGDNYGQIINCKNLASVTGTTEQVGINVDGTCGGIVGITMDKSIVKNCTNSGNVIGRDRIGGIAGYCGGGQIWYCSNNGNVTGYTRTGGIVGILNSATDYMDFPVERCYNAGTIVGTSDYTGGIVGQIEKPWGAEETGIENTYNTGSIQGTDYVGGLIGNLPYGCKIRISHNVGTVSGTGSNVGQLTGKQESGSEIFISYYRSDTDTNDYAMTTEKFKNLSNFGGDSGYWRNGEVWTNGEDYPILISAEMIKAREVSTYIGNIGEVSYTPGSKEKIVAAKEAYDNLTKEEKALIPQETKDALQKAIDDYDAVDAVVLLIDAIGEVSYPDSKDAIDKAKTAVSTLSNDQKDMLGEYENTLKEAEADYAEGAIDAIGDVTYPGSKDAIDAAKDAIADFDDGQLALVGNLGDLKDAEKEFAKGAIGAIGDVTFPGSKDAIDAAKAAVADLDDGQLAEVDNLGDLKDAETEFAKGAIGAIGDVTYPDSKDAIDAAKDAIADFDDGQLALVSNLGDLEDAEKLYDAMGKIGAIGDVSYPDSKDAIDAAKAAVADLDEDQLPLVDNLNDLKDAEVEFAKGAIGAIGDVSYPGSKDAIDAAKAAIADLDDDQLALVSNLGDLEDAEKLYDAMGKISAIGDVTFPGSKDAIDGAKDAVGALDEDQLPLLGDYLNDLKDAEVAYVEGAIDAIGQVSFPDSRDAIDAAKDAVDALDEDLLSLLDNLNDLSNAEAEYVVAAIDAIGEVVYPTSKGAIDAAKEAVEALDEDLLHLVYNLDDLKAAEAAFARGAIDAIGEITYPDSIDAIEAALEALEGLDEEQLALIDNLDDLINAEAAFAEEAINAIGEVTYPSSKDAIDLAKEIVAGLDEEQRALISNLDKLIDAEIAFAEGAINAIGEVTYPGSKAAIDAAKEIVAGLDEEQRALISNLDKLIDAEIAFAEGAINAIGEVTYSTESENKIKAAKEAIGALDEEKRALISNIDVYDEAAATYVERIIAAIGEVELTKESKEKIDNAREAFEALSEKQKALVDNVAELNNAEDVYDAMAKIDAIGEVALTQECKEKIDIARTAYDKVAGSKKALVMNRDTLFEAEATYASLAIADIGDVALTEEVKDKIDAAKEAYDNLPTESKGLVDNAGTLNTAEKVYDAMDKISAIGEVTYSTESENKIKAAKEAFALLSDEQKELVGGAETIATAEIAYAEAKRVSINYEAANGVIGKIKEIENGTLTDAETIAEVRAAYESLTDDQKALVTNYDILVTAEENVAAQGNKLPAGLIAFLCVLASLVLIMLCVITFMEFRSRKRR